MDATHMKFKQMKLAGFKSFVDPTVLDLRSDLVCVVGPNGCGKSNVIDGVRWVMGESSAKTLRGESITDVIFNGSNTRKPVGQASIELIFDNSDGTIGGEYASYAEISVRREVNRDAVSNYYLNGTRCRRRDIVDVFLGTGLGARSYSIIEQGMISRIIESKPEDLRCFIEEAAGISVYKKRRHDTELRMRHTTENLARLEDLREEQIKLLERLKRQSESAQKFRNYDSEKQLLESQLLALRWQEYDAKLSGHAEDIRNLAVNLEEKLAARASIDSSLEKVRAEYEENSDIFNAVQSKFYELGSTIARNEQSLQHHKERKVQLENDVEEIKNTIIDISAQKSSDSDSLFECEEKIAQVTPEYEQACIISEQADESYQDARLSLDNWNEEWDEYQQQAQVHQQQAEVQKMRIEQLDKQTRDLQARIDRLQQESASLDVVGVQATVLELNEQLEILESKTSQLKAEIIDIQAAIGAQRSELQQQQDELNSVRNSVQQNKGREASLLALQQAALGKDDHLMQEWLSKHNLASMPRLAESITVEAGWEQAVEAVLSDYLEAVCINEQWDDIVAAIDELTDGKLTIVGLGTENTVVNGSYANLTSKVTTSLAIDNLLQDILIAENLETAIAMRPQLTAQQTVVTKDGIWLGKSWLRVTRERDGHRGVLQREQEIQNLKTQLEQQSAIALSLEESIHQATANLQDLETSLATQQLLANQELALLREISAKSSAAQQKLENMQNRKQRIGVEIEDHQQQVSLNSADASAARTDLEIAIEAMAGFAVRKEQLTESKEELQIREKTAKQNAKDRQEHKHELELEKQSLTTKYAGLQHTISRVDQQLAGLHTRHQQLNQSLADDLEPTKILQEELDTLLEQRIIVEKDLNQARGELAVFEEQMKQHEKQRVELEKTAQEIKDILDKCRMERQSVEIRKETINEQLVAHNIDVKVVLESLPPDAEESAWAERIDALHKKISNLGAINMAAIEEFDSETQRQQYLESQYADLKEALTTLENAIKKIDRETRTKFKETYDQVNTNFNALFPKLFGGGKAYLEIVGEDLLDAGVTVMAMPPGKKNSSIHLLSGGEKALTAVALVFSIFQLNPAPFCMLDEVDAPLDESNVVRFSNLIREMSATVQFIMITHNKTTMEIANQLIGVTMKEPGVSRLVSVDINEAVEMAIA
jgi:chromosome segregation protein